MNINLSLFGKEHIIEIDRDHYVRRLGMPTDHELSENIVESMDWAVEWYAKNGDPWIQIYELDVRLVDEKIYLNDFLVNAPKVFKRFKKYEVKKAMLVVSTAGHKVDAETTALWSSDYPDRSFFLDTYAASVTEAIVTFAVNQINEWAAHKKMSAIARYSPGYPGWELKEQILLMKIVSSLSEGEIPVTVSDTALLSPLKSQLSLIGVHEGENKEKPVEIECMQCTFMDCGCRDKGLFIKKNKN